MIQSYITVRGGEGEYLRTTQYPVTIEVSVKFGARADLYTVEHKDHMSGFGDSVAEAVDALQELVRGR